MDSSLTELGELALKFIRKAMCHEYLRQLWRRRLNGVCESHSVMSDSLQPHGLYSPWNSPCYNTVVGSLSLLQGIFPTRGLNPGLPHCRLDSLPTEPQEQSKNTAVGSLSLLEGIFQTQELSRGLLHCRQILHQLICQASPEWGLLYQNSKYFYKAMINKML